jgi:hypothetical protein
MAPSGTRSDASAEKGNMHSKATKIFMVLMSYASANQEDESIVVKERAVEAGNSILGRIYWLQHGDQCNVGHSMGAI